MTEFSGPFNTPIWTTATRPSNPGPGVTGFNSDLLVLEFWNGMIWSAVGAGGGSVGYVFTTDFNGIGNGSSDNSSAWNAFATQARSDSAAGLGVVLYIPPGTYNYDHSQCQQFLQNIKRLRVVGYGAKIQNTYNQSIHGANASFEWPWGPACQPVRNFSGTSLGYLIQTTVPFATTATLLTPGDSANFAIGDWVMLASLDIQYLGFPGNTDQFEFLQISNINGGTGVITFNQAIRYPHLSTFPDGGNPLPCGKARIWQLNSSGWPIGKVTWDIDHTYEGLTVLPAPTSTEVYQTFTGRRIRTIDWTGVGPSESIAQQVEHQSPTFNYQGEPDKCVSSIVYNNMNWNAGARLVFQSSSIDSVLISNSVINGGLNSGSAKNVTIDNCDIDSLTTSGSTQGLNRSTIVRNSRAYGSAYVNLDIGEFIPNTFVDGSNVSFANGTFTILKSFNDLTSWNMVVGQKVNLCANANAFNTQAYSGNLGTGIVASLREDSTHVFIDTTLPFTVLPAWASNKVRIIRVNDVSYENCSGSDAVRVGSLARFAAKSSRNLFHYRFLGKFSRAGGWFLHVGNLISLTFNVRSAAPTAGTIKIDCATFNATTMADTGVIEFTFNTAIAGKRLVTQAATSGFQAGDGITLNAAPQTNLPVGLIWAGQSSWFVSWNPTTFAIYQNPIIDFELEFDNDLLVVDTTALLDQSTGIGNIAAVIGDLP